MRTAAVFDESSHKYAHRGNQQPRATFEQFDDAPTDKESEQDKNQDGRDKFHRHSFYQIQPAVQALGHSVKISSREISTV
jgi:hypothetical protein